MRKHIWSIALLLSGTLFLSACTLTIHGEADPVQPRSAPIHTPAPTPTPSVPGYPHNETITYTCSNARLAVRYTSNESAQVYYGDWQNLTRTVSQDGYFVYRNSDYSWHARGRTGFLQFQGNTVRSDCSY